LALADDIRRRVLADFEVDKAGKAMEILEQARTANPDFMTDRIVRCAVYVAGGDMATLRRALELAKTDWRDLIVWAEYDNAFGERKRDLKQPFRA
jgi:hypothetical protein